jgi:hypothetical protein
MNWMPCYETQEATKEENSRVAMSGVALKVAYGSSMHPAAWDIDIL